MSFLTVNVGGMFSGKSTELQRQGERHILAGQKVVYIKPSIDTRYSEDEIVTHKGNKVKALIVEKTFSNIQLSELLDFDVILFDEVQFFDEIIETIVNLLLYHGKTVYCSGLDMDFNGEVFPVTAKLMGIADEVKKLHAVCERCGADGVITARRNSSPIEGNIKLGAKETYIPLCRDCYTLIAELRGND